MEKGIPQFYDIVATFASMPIGQLVLVGLCALTWLIGGNILISFHYKRIGQHWASGFKPFAFPFKNFNVKEWFMLSIIAFISLSFGALALYFW